MVTHAISVRIEQTVAIAVVPGVGVLTLARELSIRVIVASRFDQTSLGQTREEITGAIVEVGSLVVVARADHGTAWELARAVVKRGVCIEVGSLGVGTAVAGGVIHAARGNGGVGVVVTRERVGATCTCGVFT